MSENEGQQQSASSPPTTTGSVSPPAANDNGRLPPINTSLAQAQATASSPSHSARNTHENGSFLSPRARPGGLSNPSSPSPSSASTLEPPSPTSSYSSSPTTFKTSTALRDNKVPDRLSPMTPDGQTRKFSMSSSATASFTAVDSSDIHGAKAGQTDPEVEEVGPAEIPDDADLDVTPFSFHPKALASLLDPKSVDALKAMGGTSSVLKGLGTDAKRGLCFKTPSSPSDIEKVAPSPSAETKEDVPDIAIVVTAPGGADAEPVPPASSPPSVKATGSQEKLAIDFYNEAYTTTLEKRQQIYGRNSLPSKPIKGLLQLMWMALKDKVLIVLSIAAVIAFALGLFQDFGPAHKEGEPRVDWVEGVAIMVAILIVVVVGALNDYQKERQFQTLNSKKDERGVKVIRDGDEQIIDIQNVVVGDIALLEPGEVVPVDGIYLSGHNVKCDESGATGESDAIRKVPYEEIIRGDAHSKADCFIVSGSKVLEGVGSYVVVAVGQKSFNGRIMMVLRGDDNDSTPLQLKLNNLAELIATVGSIAGLVLFFSLFIRFATQLADTSRTWTSSEKGIAFVRILIISVTLVVVAVPEGLPLAWTLALAFATKRMTKENLLVRVLSSCESMSNASVVCTDKTGTLTTNVMSVVAGSVGIHAKFVRNLADNQKRTNAEEINESTKKERKHPDDFSLDQKEVGQCLTPAVATLFNDAIAVNSTAFWDTEQNMFVGSKTETALLQFAKELGWANYKQTRDSVEILQIFPFSSLRKAMGVVVKMPNGGARFYVKGASEILTKICTQHVVTQQGADKRQDDEVETAAIEELEKDNIQRTIMHYANQTLRTIAICYRELEQWPPRGVSFNQEHEVEYDDLARDLTLIAITGIEDPLRPGVREAVAKCHHAGVAVKMCTGDNVLTAKSIALQCGIFTPGGIIMEGPTFRQLSDEDMLAMIPRLQVLARSSPEDKQLLVNKLKELDEVVGVTGDGTNDGPALKTANVGFAMGIAGTEVAKEASDVILMDDNFASIVKAIMWGRCVNDAVRKFLQFQLSTNVTAVIITFVSAVASASEESVLSAVQLLWINIIMDTFAALALATDPASESLLDRKPGKKMAPLFTTAMYKQILLQSVYQTVILLLFHFVGESILGTTDDLVVQTTVFNVFVFAQVFNSVNCRRLDNKLNIFEGIYRNWYFIGITAIEFGIQILIVFVGGAAFHVTPIPGREWGISIALGFVSIPLGALIRLLPDGPFTKLFTFVRLLPKEDVLPTARPHHGEQGEWMNTMEDIKENLGVFSSVRGGRLPTTPKAKRRFTVRPRHTPTKSSHLPDERRRPAVSALIGRFEQVSQRSTSSASNNSASYSRTSSVASQRTGDGSVESSPRVNREWPPKNGTNNGVSTGSPEQPPRPYSYLHNGSPSANIVGLPSKTSSLTATGGEEAVLRSKLERIDLTPSAAEDSADTPIQEAFKSKSDAVKPETQVEQEAPVPVPSSNASKKTSTAVGGKKAPPASLVPPKAPSSVGSKTPTASRARTPIAARTGSAPAKAPVKTPITAKPSVTSAKTPTKPAIPPVKKTPIKATAPKNNATPPVPPPSHQPKTPTSASRNPPSRSGTLFAPTAASLAKAKDAPSPGPKTPTKKPTLSKETADRLSKPTAASASRLKTPSATPNNTPVRPKVPAASSPKTPPVSAAAAARAAAMANASENARKTGIMGLKNVKSSPSLRKSASNASITPSKKPAAPPTATAKAPVDEPEVAVIEPEVAPSEPKEDVAVVPAEDPVFDEPTEIDEDGAPEVTTLAEEDAPPLEEPATVEAEPEAEVVTESETEDIKAKHALGESVILPKAGDDLEDIVNLLETGKPAGLDEEEV